MKKMILIAVLVAFLLIYVAGNKSGGKMKISDKGLTELAKYEGFSAKMYNDPGGHNATIGYGHLIHRGPIDGNEPQEFLNGITHQRGLELLRKDVSDAENTVNHGVTVKLTQDQFDALVDFAYNVGAGAFASSTALAKVNAGLFDQVPAALGRFNKSGGVVLAGLVSRRAAEGAAFA